MEATGLDVVYGRHLSLKRIAPEEKINNVLGQHGRFHCHTDCFWSATATAK
jgi:hypothetical protein